MRRIVRKLAAVAAAAAIVFAGTSCAAPAQSQQVPSGAAGCFTEVQRFTDGTGVVLVLSNDPRTDGLCPGVPVTDYDVTSADAVWACESMPVVCDPIREHGAA